MDSSLLDAFRSTVYHACLSTIAWAPIRIDLPQPADLTAIIGTKKWGFVTAWNPMARRRSGIENLAEQQALFAAMSQLPQTTIYPALGVSQTGWSEPSMLVAGIEVSTLDALMHEYRQLAYVHGSADLPATLRVLEQGSYIDVDPRWSTVPPET